MKIFTEKEINALNSTWPFNLLNAIKGEVMEGSVYSVSFEGLEAALDTLEEREANVIIYRFRDKLTLQETGDKIGLSKTRIGQIESKALRKLRHPSRVNSIKAIEYYKGVGYDRMLTITERNAKAFIKLRKQYNEMLQLLSEEDRIRFSDIPKYNGAEVDYDSPIDDLEFSVRTYNVLRRAGVSTVSELLKRDKEDIMKIRNMNRKSFEEIDAKIKELIESGL